MKTSENPVSRGRPRAFDPEKALDAAMRVFQRKGYEGTSLSDLTEAMGINRPSLYAAFGNKEELFRKALDRYTGVAATGVCFALEAPTAREAVERLLYGACEVLGRPGSTGCMTVVGALTGSDDAQTVKDELCSVRRTGEARLQERFDRAKREGDLGPDVDTEALAKYIATVQYGLSVQATGDTTPGQLRKIVDTALRAWPDENPA